MNVAQVRGGKFYKAFSNLFYMLLRNTRLKEKIELLYWKLQRKKEGTLTNHHYEYFFTTYFGFQKSDYSGKKVLDIGCGPRGSLEWVDCAGERIGLDPLANEYLKLGGNVHQMTYVAGVSENIPFPDEHFDFVSSFNSLDHVDDLAKSISEIKRILKPNGYFLLIADIHDHPTLTEPSAFSWDIVPRFADELEIVRENHLEGHQLYKSIRAGIQFNHNNPKPRYGVLTFLAKKQTKISKH